MRGTNGKRRDRQEPMVDERTDRAAGMTGPSTHAGRTDSPTEAFVAHRSLLFTVAYEMLGTAADAEAKVRWAQ
ncbi:hypothetical protein SAMN02787144_1004282 [Streptomyces atratus]|uniref:Uncharacterized protein n=2 Tax=Streptomyces atratus TaxID=1893 RepID=A0A1K1YHY0_STRAR|nr:hypothetical protein SAMN02787144_1004282 [Streptomyces atratus]